MTITTIPLILGITGISLIITAIVRFIDERRHPERTGKPMHTPPREPVNMIGRDADDVLGSRK